jgi:hypothetical protein
VKQIPSWSSTATVTVAESAGGVLATIDPLANLVRAGVSPWPPAELLQKLYGSDRWRGKTDEDDRVVREALGHYSDLQSLNSEDAITWSFLGPLIYGPPAWRLYFAAEVFEALGFPKPSNVSIWLWRRIPHPEKPSSTGGPEVDFGIQSEQAIVLGEAKWNSQLGTGQGVAGNRSQLDLRLAYCSGQGKRALPSTHHWAVLGVGRTADVVGDTTICPDATVQNISWSDLISFMPSELRPELAAYVAWKERHSSGRSNKRMEPPRGGLGPRLIRDRSNA